MVAQKGVRTQNNPVPLRYGALALCMYKTMLLARTLGFDIACPKFGCGLAGGNWEVIRSMIDEIWEDNGIETKVYYI